MANDKVNYTAIAQALKFQIRAGSEWDGLGPPAKEALDQIATLIARTVSGEPTQHWHSIISYAQAVLPEPPPTIDIERGIRSLVRDLPRANDARSE